MEESPAKAAPVAPEVMAELAALAVAELCIAEAESKGRKVPTAHKAFRVNSVRLASLGLTLRYLPLDSARRTPKS